VVADGAFQWRCEPVAEGERVTTSAPPRLLPVPKAANDAAPQESAIAATIRQSIGEVPVILCGSRGNGTNLPLSDYDVLVVLPWRQMPFAIRKLRALSAHLTGNFGTPVTINPLPERNLRRHMNLFLWKVAHEGRVLSSPPGFALPSITRPPYNDSVRFSYLMSALLELLKGVGGDPFRRDDATHKAVLMLAQLRLLERGLYANSLDDALADLEPEDREFLELDETADLWRQTCSKVVAELASVSRPDPATAVRVNARYVVLALLRGRIRLQAALSLRGIDRRLADSAALLAGTLIDRTAADPAAITTASKSLPRSLRRRTSPTWKSLRAVLEQEWPDAHPLIAQ
jgi:predicted nucleotidyltransferase